MSDREGDPGRRRPRRRELGRRRRARARERDARPAARRPSGSTSSPLASAPTCPSSSRTGPQLGEGDGTRLDAAWSSRRPSPSLVLVPTARRKESTASVYARVRRAERVGRLRRSAAPPCWPRSPPATSPRCRRTTSPRSPLAAELARARRASAPTSAAPARPSTGCSRTRAAAAASRPRCRAPRLGLDRASQRGRLRA